MNSKSDKIEIMINDEVYEILIEIFDTLKNRYQNNLESMKGSEFLFDYIYLLSYKCHDSLDLVNNKKTTINPTNKIIINAFNTLQQSR